MAEVLSSDVCSQGGLLDAWTFVKDEELSRPSLNKAQRDLLANSTAKDVVHQVQQLETEHGRRSHARDYMGKVQTLLIGLDKFGAALDVFSNADKHGILSLVWGSIRLVLAVVKDFHDYLEELLGFLAHIGNIFGRLQAYEKLVPTSLRLNKALCSVFREFLDFMHFARLFFSSENSPTGFRALIKAKVSRVSIWTRFRNDANRQIHKIQDLCDEADREVRLAVTERQDYKLEEITAALKDQSVTEDTAAYRNTLKDFGTWLAPVAVNDDLEAIRDDRMERSCDWLNNDPAFIEWKNVVGKSRTSSLLWISGAPGTGKTYLSSFLVDHLRLQTSVVGYFFCKSEDQAKKSAFSVMRTWAWQLFSSLQQVSPNLLDFHTKGGTIGRAVVTEILIQLAVASRPGVLIVDGLDECSLEDQQQVLSVCNKLLKDIKIVIVSRPESHIQVALVNAAGSNRFPHVRITEDRNRRSIDRYILKGVESLPALSEAEQKSEVAASLSKRAGGVFLWVRLMLEHLSAQLFVEEVMEALEEAPEGLPNMYSRTLDSIDQMPKKHTQMAYKILQWMLFGLRPLTLEELRTAVAIEPGSQSLRQLQNIEKLVPQLCKSLVEIDQYGRTVRLVHASVKDFLLGTVKFRNSRLSIMFEPSDANAHLAEACLTFLSIDRPYPYAEKFVEANLTQFRASLKAAPLLEYSSVFWVQHMACVSKRPISDQNPATFGLSSRNVIAWLQVVKALDLRPYPGLSLTKDLVDSLLMTTSSEVEEESWILFGDTVIADIALRMLRSHLGEIGRGRASRWRRFLSAGYAHSNVYPPLSVASYFDFIDVVQDQVASGWSIHERDENGDTAFFFPIRADAMNTLEYMLREGADINALQERDNGNAACYFAFRNDLDSIQMANPFSPNKHLLSSESKHQAKYLAAHRLLSAGADPMTRGWCGDTVLHGLIRDEFDAEPELEVAAILLDHGAQLRATNDWSQRPLYLTAEHDAPRLAQLFITHERAKNGTRSVLELIDYHVEGRIDSALFKACSRKDSRVAAILIDEGADVMTKSTWNHRSILQVSLAGACTAIPRLLERGADANAKDLNGNTALHDAARLNLPGEINLLVEHGAHIDAVNSVNKTPAQVALNHGSVGALKMLLELGSRLDVTGLDFSSATGVDSAIIQRLQGQQSGQSYFPKCSRDVFEAYFILKNAFQGRIDGFMMREILESAQYWLRSSSDRDEAMTFDQHNCKEPYVRSLPIVGRTYNPVQKIVFRITSRDQGFSDFPLHHGTYDGSYSWFEAWCVRSDSSVEKARQKITHNIHAGCQFKRHVRVWSPSEGSEDLLSVLGTKWITRLRPGDSVHLVPLADYPGWLNIVEFARLEVYSSILPLKQSPQPRV